MITQEQSAGASATSERWTGGDRGGRFGWARTLAAVIACILGGLVVLLAAGNLLPAATNIVTLAP